jgi:hypothetical protein
LLPYGNLAPGVEVTLKAFNPFLMRAGVNLGEYRLESANSGDEIVGQLGMPNRTRLESSRINFDVRELVRCNIKNAPAAEGRR